MRETTRLLLLIQINVFSLLILLWMAQTVFSFSFLLFVYFNEKLGSIRGEVTQKVDALCSNSVASITISATGGSAPYMYSVRL